MNPLEELAVANRERAALPYARRVRGRASWLQRYRRYCGRRSFIFQAILLSWTVTIGLWMLATLFWARGDRRMAQGRVGQEIVLAEAAGSVLCMAGAWAIIGVPLGLAALLTLREDSGD